MSNIFLIYNEHKLHSVTSNERNTINMIKDKFDLKDLDKLRIEKYSVNNMYNHSKEREFSINSNFQLQEIKYA